MRYARTPPAGLLTDLNAEVASALKALGKTQVLRPNQDLFYEGDPPTTVFLPLSGHLKATRLSEEGEARIVAVFRPGALLGEMAPLEGKARSATVTAIKAVELLSWPADVFFDFADREPSLWRHMAMTLSQRLRDLNALHTARHFLPFKGQLAVVLLQLAEDLGTQSRTRGTCIDLKLTQSDLAEMVGATREYVSRAVRDLIAEGILAKDDGRYVLCAPQRLEQLAEGLKRVKDG
ncbi:MAG: Crp/Fnr family transcriptional regulator [Pseudomonadota bacterium]